MYALLCDTFVSIFPLIILSLVTKVAKGFLKILELSDEDSKKYY